LQPELTTFGSDRPMQLMIEHGMFQRLDCAPPVELKADGADQLVKGEPLFDTMSARVVDRRRVDVAQKLAGRLTWKGMYAVSKDQRSMTLDFDDERPSTPVTGTLLYVRVGDPVTDAHALSGRWQPNKLARVSASGSTLAIRDETPGITMSWSDGREVTSPIDAKYYILKGYLAGAQASILRPRPDTLAINRQQGIFPVEVSRAIVSADGQTLTFQQVDWVCRALTTFTYRRQPAS
jgi:hypothetical protein